MGWLGFLGGALAKGASKAAHSGAMKGLGRAAKWEGKNLEQRFIQHAQGKDKKKPETPSPAGLGGPTAPASAEDRTSTIMGTIGSEPDPDKKKKMQQALDRF